MRLGVVGGGQLGSLFAGSVRRLGHTAIVLDPDPHCPAALVADQHVRAAYEDLDAVRAFALGCDAVTVEFENVPAPCLEAIADARPMHPAPAAVAVAADRRSEKRLLRSLGVPVAAFDVVDTAADVERVVVDGGLGGGAVVVKTARLGYDGKGQVRASGPDRIDAAWRELGAVPCVVERLLPLDRELSIVMARSADGATATYPPTVNEHVAGILDTSVVAPDEPHRDEAADIARRIAEHLGYVGVLAVEFFVSENELLVNELAPRPHNSGHWTIDGAPTSQFDQQARVLAGLPLGATAPNRGGIAMANLLGERWAAGEPRWEAVEAVEGAVLHLYGKREPRPGRKMGHLTVLRDDPQDALATARDVREALSGP
jgi:5-(carboxyamino)imidazole ribonucleotide synthase